MCPRSFEISESEPFSNRREYPDMANSKKTAKSQPKAGSAKKMVAAPDPLLVRPPWARTPPKPFVLSDLRVLNAMADVPGGQPNLMSASELYDKGVQCEVEEWRQVLPIGNDLLKIYINNVLWRDAIPFGKPLSQYSWPYKFTIPENEIGEHGLKNIFYEVVSSDQKVDRPTAATPVTIDRRDPNAGIRPEPMILANWVGRVVTPADLEANGGMESELPRRLDAQEGDKVAIYSKFPSDTPILTITDLPRTTAAVLVTITKEQLLNDGPGPKALNYVYTDRAGNQTVYPSAFREFTLVTEDLPKDLPDPECPEAPLDLLDAQLQRAEIWIWEYTNPVLGDRILIEFNTLLVVGIVDLVWPLKVKIPWDVLRDGGLDAPYQADVFYNVERNGVITGPSETITVDVDLTSAGGNPDNPGPVNPDLDPVTVTSSQGLINEIGPGDFGDATAQFATYTGADAGHLLQLWWGKLPIFDPPYVVTLADVTAGEFDLVIPAEKIKEKGNGPWDVFYSLKNGVNQNTIDSVTTTVQVNAFSVDNLIPIIYPDALDFGDGQYALTCAQNIDQGIRLVIKDPANLRKGDEIEVRWIVYGPDDFGSQDIVVDETFPPIMVTHDHNIPGHVGELLNVPYPTFIQPVMTGRIEARYLVKKADGFTEGESEATIVLITRRKTDGGICGV